MNAEQFSERFNEEIKIRLNNENAKFTVAYPPNTVFTEDGIEFEPRWAYHMLLELYDAEDGPIRASQQEKRKIGMLKFVCNDCAGGNHDPCRGGTHCDCQHMVSKKTRDQVEK